MEVCEACAGAAVCWLDNQDDSWCGTQRVARALAGLPQRYVEGPSVIVNWQADEPELQSADVDRMIEHAHNHLGKTCEFVTMTAPYRRLATKMSNVTKAKLATIGRPEVRDFARLTKEGSKNVPHVGIYAFRPLALAELAVTAPSVRSIGESLEQLTWIDAGWRCEAIPIDYEPQGINTLEDYRRFRDRERRE